MIELDHVVYAVADLDEAGREFERRHGLRSVPGGRHPGWGTANRIVPLGATYLELAAVVDPAEAELSAFGRWLAHAEAGPIGWAVRTDRLDELADRLDLPVVSGSRGELRWRAAGFERAAAEPLLPFLIEWGEGTSHPGAEPAGNDTRELSLELTGDLSRLDAWLGPHELPVAVRPGAPAVARVVF